MKVLMITGDRTFGPGHPRFELQKSAVDALEVIYFGRGSLWPKIPAGDFDVVTTQDAFWRGLFGWQVARRKKALLNVQVHTDLASASFIKHILSKIVLRHADSVRVVSQRIKQQVEHFGVHAPIIVLPVFVDIERFRNISHVERAQKMILWLGRFEPEKDPLYAIDIFKKICDAGVDAKLIMLGKGSLEKQLRAEAGGVLLPGVVHLATGGITPPASVDFPGWQDPASYLAQADVVLCTSLHESWGASIVEALAAGVPVVAPDVGIAREAGALVVPREDLSAKIIEALRSGQRGELLLSLPTAREWSMRWRESVTAGRVGA